MDDFDVIVVGARVAGAATAMLLARRRLRVLVLDRGRYGTDTLSTHALMRGGVHLLSRWGLLDRIIAAGTPPVTQTRFHYDTDVTVSIKPSPGVRALYAPRRTLLDRVIVDAAMEAGADIRFGVSVSGLLNDDGRVIGVYGRDRDGHEVTARARLVVGADGIRSTVAHQAGAAELRRGCGAGAVVYGYWSQLPTCGYEWFYRPGFTAGFIPTNGDQICVFAGCPASELVRTDLHGTYHRMLAAATRGHEERLTSARPPQRLHTWVGRTGFVRRAHGPGWVLIGDAAYFLDPLSTHGITDALRDAELLSAAVTAQDFDTAVEDFARRRGEVVDALFGAVDEIAGYQWDPPRIRRLLLDLNSAMGAEMALLTG